MYSKPILCFLLFPFAIFAQAPHWKKFYRELGNLSHPKLLQASDSGFIFSAVRQNHPSKYYTVKIDPNGVITERNWVNPPVDKHSIHTLDGGKLFLTYQEVPYTRSESEGYYARLEFPISTLYKVNRHGVTEWIKKYHDTLFLFNAIQTLDSGYLIHGRSYAGLQFFQKLDAHGSLIWQKHRTVPVVIPQRHVAYPPSSFTTQLLKDGGFIVLGIQGEASTSILLLCRMDSVCNIAWDTIFKLPDHWRMQPQFYLNSHQDITWLEQTNDTIALVQWHIDGSFARRTVIPLPMRTRLEYALLTQHKKGGFGLLYGTREQSHLMRLEENLNIIRRKAIPYYLNYVQHFGELDENRLYFVSYENELHLTVTDMEGNIAQNYIYGKLLTECHSYNYRDWTIEATRSDGKVYTTKVNTYLNFEFLLDTGRYKIRAYTPLGDWTAWETVVSSTRRYQRDTTFLVIRCKDTPHLSLDITTPSLHACQENEYVIRFCNSGVRGVEKGILEVTLDSLMDYVESSWGLERRLGRTLRFHLGMLYPNRCDQIKIKVRLGCGDSFRLGTSCRVKAVLYPDSLTAHSEVIVSEVKQNILDLQAELKYQPAAIDYTLRFGHAGQDTIDWFGVRDTLSEWLDPSTIEILSSNYPYIWELEDGNILKIDFFEKILPNQPPVFVKFRVKPKANIPKNTQIQHQVGVYLNFEPPILIHHQTLWK